MHGCNKCTCKKKKPELFIIFDVFDVEEELDLDKPEDDMVPGTKTSDDVVRLIRRGLYPS